MVRQKQFLFVKVCLLFSICVSSFKANSLGVLTHEAIVDAAWDRSILPLLKSRYPAATTVELKEAHAYCYGGAVAPDMGYYPFGSHLFTNLVHYVRSGEMVNSLLRNANTLNEYAFALGYLSHYNADNYGHPLATNISVPLLYKKMKKRYGDRVTYAQDRISHLRMEFGFDVLQTAKGNYASDAYHDFIGFKVDTSVLARAFLETYGLDINKIFGGHLTFSVEVFRFMAASVLPLITRTAWATKSDEILKKDQTATSKRFRYKMSVQHYDKQFGRDYRRRGVFPTVLSFFIRVMPKVGPLRPLKFKTPNAEAEGYFVQSFDSILLHYNTNLQQLKAPKIYLRDYNCCRFVL